MGDQRSDTPRPKKLLDQIRDILRLKHYSRRTEEVYINWIRRYILFHHKCHPKEMGVPEIEAFLTHLAVDRNVAASTQNQALSALIFLYREVLQQELSGRIDAIRAKTPQRVPTVLTKEEAQRIIARLSGTCLLPVKLLYGSGLRVIECVRLAVYLPYALAQKYPNAAKEWIWQYVFPANRVSTVPRTGIRRRHHLDESWVQKAVKKATQQTGIPKKVSCHTFRHSFATRLTFQDRRLRVQPIRAHAVRPSW